jgi:hypothetical protein
VTIDWDTIDDLLRERRNTDDDALAAWVDVAVRSIARGEEPPPRPAPTKEEPSPETCSAVDCAAPLEPDDDRFCVSCAPRYLARPRRPVRTRQEVEDVTWRSAWPERPAVVERRVFGKRCANPVNVAP